MLPTDGNSSNSWDAQRRSQEGNNYNCSWSQTVPTKGPKHGNWPSLWATRRSSHPRATAVNPWDYNRRIYKRRNEVERLFRRLKGYRRVFTRYDKLDVIFLAFITLALIHDTLRSVNTP